MERRAKTGTPVWHDGLTRRLKSLLRTGPLHALLGSKAAALLPHDDVAALSMKALEIPLRCDGEKIDKHTPGIYLRAALKQLGLTRAGLGWYEATRHTFASQWVMAGASIEKLKEILGHYSVVMTERYAHLRPDSFPRATRSA